jgi:hypothetical protein
MKCRSKHSGRIEIRGQEHLAVIAGAMKVLWKKCCEHDGMEPASKFVVFSNDNPYLAFYNRAVQQFQEASAAYQAGGYIGLTLGG